MPRRSRRVVRNTLDALLNLEHPVWAGQVVFRTELDPTAPGLEVAFVRHEQDWDIDQARVGFENAKDLECVDFRHLGVEHE